MIYYLIFVLLFLVNFRALEYTPLMDVDKFVGLPLVVAGGWQYFVYGVKVNEIKAWIICFGIVGVISTIAGSIYFPQTLKDSLVASNNFFLVLSILPFVSVLRWSKISLKAFERLIVFLGWVALFVKMSLFAFNITWNYTSYFTGNSVQLIPKQYPTELITLGLIYYFIKFLKAKNIIYLGYSLMFLIGSNIFFIQRQEFSFEFLVLVIILFKDFKRNTASIFSFVVIVLVLILFATSFFADNLEPLIAHFSESLKIFGSATKIQDNSAEARVEQFVYFLSRAFDSPIFGLGIPREGLKTNLFAGQQAFNMADMGILGIYFGSGIIGVIVYIFQIRFVYRLYKRIKTNGLIVNTLYFYLVYVTLYSIGTGKVFIYPGHFLAVIVLTLYFKGKEDKAKEHRTKQISNDDLVPQPDTRLITN